MTFKQFNRKYCRFGKMAGRRPEPDESDTLRVTPLSQTGYCGRKRICKITGDRKLCARMASLGFHPGEEVELLCRENDAQCILKIQGGTISLDNTASNSILVQSIE
jgi:ferrous iron transport protein A